MTASKHIAVEESTGQREREIPASLLQLRLQVSLNE